MPKTLRLILGDQLNSQHSWFESKDTDITYVMMEILPETSYVTHHIQKVAGFFAAMRAFADTLREAGHEVVYFKLDEPGNQQSFEANLSHLIAENDIQRFEYQLPDEFRLDQLLDRFADSLDIAAESVDSEHFLTERGRVGEFFKGKKTYLMENFYRDVRRRTGILMDGDKPLTGRWNYDAENRKSLPKDVQLPEPLVFDHDVTEIVDMLDQMKVETIGTIDANRFPWPINRNEGLQLLDYFVENCLLNFGSYQDAMSIDRPFIYHSRLSFAMNTKMLHPLEIVERVIEFRESHSDSIGIAAVEGFVRQIIGWREFMRGIYWDTMPEYELLNFFDHQRDLPEFYWTGETRMTCLRQSIGQSLSEAYAHHIQRLMVTGNFANLLGVHPDAVDRWYFGIYIDAIQWVEITNTRGMSQFADGGIAASKPYVSSANYINKMSDYCGGCYYDRKKRYGERACPFNSLYWDFFDRHREALKDNPRVGMAYRNLDRMDNDELDKIRRQAATYKRDADQL